jgi:hypothetical protein
MKALKKNESGVAMVTALLVMMLASGLMAGMYAALMANQRTQAADRDQSVAYSAAHAGLEKLTAGLAALFTTDFSPSAADINVVDSIPPAIPGFQYVAPGGGANSGYDISFTPDGAGNPAALANADITTGPFEGFKGLITPYVLTVTARSTTGNSEVRLRRELQTVAVPVFQFGIFGQNSLGFHAGPSFDFGGRVHTNQSLFLAQNSGNTLTFRDKITAFRQVVRDRLSNGSLITATGHTGNVSIPTVINTSWRNLLATESSGTITGPCIGAASTDTNCYTGWKNLSEVVYQTNIRTQATGARQLNLPLTANGALPIDLIRRPPANENVANPLVFGQRYYAQASLRILLSDRAADITALPGIVAATPPVDLTNLAAAGYAPQVGPPFRPPVPTSPGPEPLVEAATGCSQTRVSAVAGGTLTIQTTAAGPCGVAPAWVTGVPPWLRNPAATVLARVGAFNLPCTGIAPNQLLGCDTNVIPNRHPAYGIGTVITITQGDGTTVAVATTAAALANSATIAINGFNPSMRYAATQGRFFVGEDPVYCTGFSRQPAAVDQPANTLTGCTSPAGTALAANDPIYSGATTNAGTPLLSGFLKIEKQDAAGVWTDVTMELLNLGFAAPNLQGDDCIVGGVADPTPNAVIRFIRLRDNGYGADLCNGGGGVGDYARSLNTTDYWPLMLFDAREGNTRLLATNAGMNMGGLFGYVALDAGNFSQWVAGAIGATGNQALNNNGYIIYFSDRRGDHDETAGDVETGEYGNEDSINPAAAGWVKTNALEVGENFNESRVDPNDPNSAETLQMYGESPHPLAIPAGVIANMGFDGNQRPWSPVPLLYSGRGRMARPVLFRRALKIINGGIVGGVNSLPAGINIVAENPIYIQGNFNATAASATAEPNVPAAVIGDSITLLSNNFRDTMTFQYPNDMTNRNATSTGYRFAMITGKAIPFPNQGWANIEFGSDGGVHNFMKMLEDWSGQTLRYRGSMVSLYYSRQAIGIYRADANVYSPPTRLYNFDDDFLTPALLPPGTPMFRDINTLKFRQILRPNQ